MPTLLFKGFPHSDHYNGPRAKFRQGQKQDVSDETAAYLVETFGDAFEVVGSAPAKPSKNRSVKSPTKRRSSTKGNK